MPELITFSGDYSTLYNKPAADLFGGVDYSSPKDLLAGMKYAASENNMALVDRKPVFGVLQSANLSTFADINLSMTLQVENLEDYAKIDEVARLMGERFKVEFDKQLSTAGIQYSGSNLE